MILACNYCGGVVETAMAGGLLTIITLFATECWNRLQRARRRLSARSTSRDRQYDRGPLSEMRSTQTSLPSKIVTLNSL
jgi:hypothetical protein